MDEWWKNGSDLHDARKSSAFKNARKNKRVRRSEIFQALVVHDFTPVFSHPNLQDSLTSCCWASLILCLLKKDFFWPPFLFVCVFRFFFFRFFLGFVWGGDSSSLLLQIWYWRSCAQKQRTKRRRQEAGGRGRRRRRTTSLLWCLWKHCLPTWRRWYWWGDLGLDSGLWLWVCLSLWWTLPTSLWFCTRCVWVVKHWFLIASCCFFPSPPGSWIRKSQNKEELLWLPNCFLCNFTHGSGGHAEI